MMFAIVMALTIVCFLPMAYFVVGPIFGWPTGNMPAGM